MQLLRPLLFLLLTMLNQTPDRAVNSQKTFDDLLKDKYGLVKAEEISQILEKWGVLDVEDGYLNFGKTGATFDEEKTLYQEIAHLSKDSQKPTALCLACGLGEQAIRMALLGAGVRGYDISPQVIDGANKRLSDFRRKFPQLALDVQFFVADLSADDTDNIFTPNSFDFVTAKLFFHFLSPLQQIAISTKIDAALKVRGQLFLITQGPILEGQGLQSILTRMNTKPDAIDHGYSLVHVAELDAKGCSLRQANVRKFGLDSYWPYTYFISPLVEDSLNLEFGRNIEGKHENLILPPSFFNGIEPSTLKHYKYNFATIEGTKNLLEQSAMNIMELKHISSLVSLEESIFQDTSSLQTIKDEKDLMISVMIYARAFKSSANH